MTRDGVFDPDRENRRTPASIDVAADRGMAASAERAPNRGSRSIAETDED